MSKIALYAARLRKSFGMRVALYAVGGVAAALVAFLASELLSGLFPFDVESSAIDDLLTIVASSMLAVTTFSVAALTTAYGGATSNGTARATRLLTEDPVVQRSLATFVGSFLFSIVALMALKISAYGPEGRAVLFGVTLVVIVLVVVALLRWINALTRLGRVSDTVNRIEAEAKASMEARLRLPHLGGSPIPDGATPTGTTIPAEMVGYLQHVDAPGLAALADEHDLRLDVLVLPGAFIFHTSELVRVRDGASVPEEVAAAVRAAFTVSTERTFEQDPRFGLVVLTEVALRALSPAVDDPGTAIDVIGRHTRLLTEWALRWEEACSAEVPHPRLRFPSVTFDDLYDDSFNLIGRDAAGQVDVVLRLVKSLQALAQVGCPQARLAARTQLEVAAARAEEALAGDDLRRLREVLATA